MNITLDKGIEIKTHNALTYAQYLSNIERLVMQNSTSGTEQSEDRITATKLNLQRMKRIDKSFIPEKDIVDKARSLKKNLVWIVLTEAWCGDSAQNVPIINKISLLSDGNISVRYVYRDENPELMDQFLTAGSRSIPKLICFDALNGNVLGTWGPRPAQIQEMMARYKKDHPEAEKKEILYQVQLMYSRDKGQSLQEEISALLDKCLE